MGDTDSDRVDPQSPQTREAPRPPWIVWLGLAVVLAAAAALSFDALRALAVAVGIPGHLAWLLPIAVDAGAAVSCATWLGGRTTPDAARFAGRMTWSLLGVTVVGNAGQLGMHAYGVTPPWWVAALVGAIPPAVVGSTVHLIVLLVRRSDPARPTGTSHSNQPFQTAVPGPVHADLHVVPDQPVPAGWTELGTGTDHLRSTDPDHEPGQAVQPSDLRSQVARPTRSEQPDELLDQVVRWASDRADPVTARAIRSNFPVGRDRSQLLLEQLTQTTQTHSVLGGQQ